MHTWLFFVIQKKSRKAQLCMTARPMHCSVEFHPSLFPSLIIYIHLQKSYNIKCRFGNSGSPCICVSERHSIKRKCPFLHCKLTCCVFILWMLQLYIIRSQYMNMQSREAIYSTEWQEHLQSDTPDVWKSSGIVERCLQVDELELYTHRIQITCGKTKASLPCCLVKVHVYLCAVLYTVDSKSILYVRKEI